MSSAFSRLAAAAARTHDSVMGETFEFRPMKHAADRNAPYVVDPTRAITQVQGVWVDYAARAGSGAFHEPGVTPDRGAHSTTRSSISIASSSLPWRPRQGDLVIRVETQATLKIFEVLPSTPGFVRITLNGA